MNYQSIFFAALIVLLLQVFNTEAQIQVTPQCTDPYSFDWVKKATESSCTDSIYHFTYSRVYYIYIKRKDDCIAADWSNTLYNCSTNTFCYVFGFTLPEEQCNTVLLNNIKPFLSEENAIYPVELNCKPMPSFETEKGDVYIDDACYGVIMTAPNGNCFRLKVKNDGTFNSEPVRCPE